MTHRRGVSFLVDLLFFGGLAALFAFRVLADLPRYMDVALFDETRYLHQGLRLLQGEPLSHLFRARLYALWYALLAQVWSDPLALHDGNVRVLVALVPGLLYAVLRVHGLTPGWAFSLAWAYGLTDVHLTTQPRVAHLAWAVVLAGYGVFRWKSGPWGWSALLAAVWLAVYARPELVLAFGLLAGMAAWQAWRKPPEQPDTRGFWPRFRPWRRPLAVLALSMALLYLGMGSPLHESGRFLAAFGQHFAYRWGASYGIQGGAWGKWREVLERAFGPDVASFPQAVMRNPGAVARHVGRNLLELPLRLALVLWTHPRVLLPLWEEAALWAALTLALTAWLWKRGCLRLRGQGLAVWLALLAPSMFSMVVVFPRQHYALGLALAWVLALGVGLRRCLPPSRRAAAFGLVLALLALVLTPSLANRYPCTASTILLDRSLPPVLARRSCATTDVRETILALRSLQRAYGTFQVMVPADYWEKNLEVYLEPGLQPLFDVPLHPKTEGRDVVVAPHGDVWVKDPALWAKMQALKAYGVQGAFCTRGKPWVLLLRLVPPPDFPLEPCRPRFR